MGLHAAEFIKQNTKLSPGVRIPRKFKTTTDLEGHYDLDGASYACDQVVIASDGKVIHCSLKTDTNCQDSHELDI